MAWSMNHLIGWSKKTKIAPLFHGYFQASLVLKFSADRDSSLEFHSLKLLLLKWDFLVMKINNESTIRFFSFVYLFQSEIIVYSLVCQIKNTCLNAWTPEKQVCIKFLCGQITTQIIYLERSNRLQWNEVILKPSKWTDLTDVRFAEKSQTIRQGRVSNLGTETKKCFFRRSI